MVEFKKVYKKTAGRSNDPVAVSVMINNLTVWLSEEEDYKLRQSIKMCIDVMTKRFNKLKQEEGEE